MDSLQLQDTVKIHDTIRVVTGASTLDIIFLVGKWVLALLASVGGIVGGVRYFHHRRFKANETAIVRTTEAAANADVAITEAEARAQVAAHKSSEEAIKFWEKKAIKLDEMLTNAQAQLMVLQSQVSTAEREKSTALGQLEIAKERIELLREEVNQLKNRIEADKEMLAEIPSLRNQVQTLQAKCTLLQRELDETTKSLKNE